MPVSVPEGDRILILEDTSGDGQVDSEKVFYQGTDIDSPHGVCVWGIESSYPAGDNKVQIIPTKTTMTKPTNGSAVHRHQGVSA
ncbi:MAG: hypothetical protein R3C49_23825 [Planctomycetaceae bacterium]